MKKCVKYIVILVGIIVILLGVDYGSVLLRGKPLLYTNYIENNEYYIYYGLLYNTAYCEGYSKVKIEPKGLKCICFCEETKEIHAKIIEIKDSYLVIESTSDNAYLKEKDKAHLSLDNNPKIIGAHNIIIGQNIIVSPETVKEVYPSIIVTTEIYIK